jgi:hypothetical protein
MGVYITPIRATANAMVVSKSSHPFRDLSFFRLSLPVESLIRRLITGVRPFARRAMYIQAYSKSTITWSLDLLRSSFDSKLENFSVDLLVRKDELEGCTAVVNAVAFTVSRKLFNHAVEAVKLAKPALAPFVVALRKKHDAGSTSPVENLTSAIVVFRLGIVMFSNGLAMGNSGFFKVLSTRTARPNDTATTISKTRIDASAVRWKDLRTAIIEHKWVAIERKIRSQTIL